MQETASIGGVLKRAREERGLSLQEIHDATKITAQNLAALEEDRFEAFPNKVYARAFLRDYANFLSLDSATLVNRYEEEWGGAREVEPVRPVRTVAPARRFAYSLLILLVLAGAGVASYYWWIDYEQNTRAAQVVAGDQTEPRKPVARVLPAVPVAPPEKTPPQPPKPLPPPKPAQPEKVVLEVTALRDVWVGIWSDGRKMHDASIPSGASRTFEGSRRVRIRVGMAGAVQLKLNGASQPPLGTLKVVGDKVFSPPAPSPTPAAASASPARPAQAP